MTNRYFALGTSVTNRLEKAIRIVFGIVCLAIAVFWIIFNFRSLKTDITLWVTITFLLGFGLYQIWSGSGRATIFIEICDETIRVKKNPLMPPVEINVSEIEKIELFPLNVIFFLRKKKRLLLRFGSTFYETNIKVKEEIIKFAGSNKIPLEFIEEKI